MLTKERVLGTSWAYRERRYSGQYQANFEVLEVDADGKLGTYIYWLSDHSDLSELDELDLDKLEELVQTKLIIELKDIEEDDEYLLGEYLVENIPLIALLSATALAIVGAVTFYAGIHTSAHHHLTQRPWEVAIGAVLMIGAVLAVAIRRT